MNEKTVMTQEEIDRELSWLRLKYPDVCFRKGDFYSGDKVVWSGWSKEGKEWIDKALENNRKIYPNIIYMGGNFYKEPFKIKYKDGKFNHNGCRIWLEEENPIPITVESPSTTFEDKKAWLDKMQLWFNDEKFYKEKLKELKEKYGIKN
ncbi:hypothetical protein [Fusobacterium ulcerans]|uniref:hypothetical protein n=1 Tax=Fusobacterium ulcerans TaxID=861 RepID=UPI0026E96D40|nr:hypothetical protein [Fusobacterium ulcerans]